MYEVIFMNKICPLCNKIIEQNFCCNACGKTMEDKGRVEEFLGPYSADMPIENKGYCTHVYKCENCGNVKNINFKEINY